MLSLSLSVGDQPGYIIATKANPTRIPVSCTTGCHKSLAVGGRGHCKRDINSARYASTLRRYGRLSGGRESERELRRHLQRRSVEERGEDSNLIEKFDFRRSSGRRAARKITLVE